MSYKEKPQIKLYKYENSAFVLQAIIDDYAECSFEDNRFEAGQFSITINYNIPNALKFERGLWIQFGNNQYKFGEILNITDSIGADGKGSQIRIITGYDARYIFKRRIIKNLNNNDTWSMTAKGEICMRNLIQDQCGSGAETKRQLPITNIIPDPANAIGAEYSVSDAYSNLYEVLTTIATQSEIGWRLHFGGSALTLEFYEGVDRHLTVRFDTDYESLSNGEFTDSAESYANTVYVGGKGTGSERDIYEGEELVEDQTPSGLDRFEAWDNQSEMTTEDEYEAEALSMLSQYGQTLEVSGNGLAKCPYEYEKEYNVGDIITIAFSGKSAVVQILSVTEHWTWGNYNLEFTFGKPINNLGKQLQLMLKQIQKASSKTTATESVKWYSIPTATSMSASDVTFDTIGFSGDVGSGATFTLYLDDEKTGSKNYNLYIRNLSGTGKLTLTTGKTGATNAVLEVGNYVGRIYVDENGNVKIESLTATSTIASGNNQPVTSGGVADAINNLPVDKYKVLNTDSESVLFYIGSTWNAQSYQAFTNIYMRGGRVNGRYGEAFLSLVQNNLFDGKLLTPMDNIQIFITQENNELKLYALLESYSFLILEFAPYSRFNIDIQRVGQTSGTLIFQNNWARIVTNLNDLGLGNLKAVTYPAANTGRQMFYDMVDAGIFIDRDGFKITCLGSYGGDPVSSIYQMSGIRYLYNPDGVEVGRLVYNNESAQGYELRILACKLN